MGKRIITQRRGRGSLRYRAPRRGAGKPRIPRVNNTKGYVKRIFHDPAHTSTIAEVVMENGEKFLMPAHLGMYEGEDISIGHTAKVVQGNILPLGSIPEGVPIYSIEKNYGDGGKFVKSGGASAQVVTHGEKTTVQMPSGEFKSFDPRCRAVVGVVAGGGRKEKPMLKAGKKYHVVKSKARKHITVSGVSMNAVDHPHGGGKHHHVGRPSTVSVHAPPGRKVGRLSPKKKKKRKR